MYDNGYTEEERKAFKPIIYKNIKTAMVRIVEGMEEIGLTFESDELKTKVFIIKKEYFYQLSTRYILAKKLGESLSPT